MCKSKAPAPPDPRQTAAAQTSTSIGTALANANLNNVNQVTPYGNLTYSQSGSNSWTDPYTRQTYDIPQFTATQTLSPEGQGIHDANVGTQQNLADIGQQQSGFLKDYLGQPVDLSSDNVRGYINTHFDDDFSKSWGENRGDLENQLANRGIRMGSDAYTKAIDDYMNQRSNARDNLYGNQFDRAQQSILTERNQPINEITALLSGSQVSQPNYVNTGQNTIPTTDVAGLIGQNYSNQLGAYNQKEQSRQNMLGGLFGLGAAVISDRRAKTDIEKVGKTDDGQNVYKYRYKAGGPFHMGLMAQKVEKKHPEAVVRMGDILAVNYDKALEAA